VVLVDRHEFCTKTQAHHCYIPLLSTHTIAPETNINDVERKTISVISIDCKRLWFNI
jgi:hypothetical protein